MSRIDVVAPENAEGTRATVLRWCKRVGDRIVKDEPLLELETDKVTVEVPAPASGTLAEVLKLENAEVSPDDVLGRLSVGEPVTGAAAVTTALPSAAADAVKATAPSTAPGGRLVSPSVRRMLHEHALGLDEVAGSGRDGRVTAQDVMRHVAQPAAGAKPSSQSSPESSSESSAKSSPKLRAQAPAPEPQTHASSDRVPHTAIRRRVAEHMQRSLADAPHVTTVFEADLTRVLKHRSLHAETFAARGARLTLTAYFVNACARALQAHPKINATFHADGLELHADANIGVGTALGDHGLIVPVIHHAQSLDLFDTAQRLNRMVAAARSGTLAPHEVRGGTFTISNHGVSGSLLAAPIVINQPQVAILGIGKVQRRACVVGETDEESIAVRSMCYLTLTLDHRALDAFQANAFLSAVVAALQAWPTAA